MTQVPGKSSNSTSPVADVKTSSSYFPAWLAQLTRNMAESDALSGFSCATDKIHHNLLTTDSSYRVNQQAISQIHMSLTESGTFGKGPVWIPIVFHIAYKTEAEDICKEQIDSQVEALNRDFNARNQDIKSIPNVWRDRAGNAEINLFRTRRGPQGEVTKGITKWKNERFLYTEERERITTRT
jgi:hypothetical protein